MFDHIWAYKDKKGQLFRSFPFLQPSNKQTLRVYVSFEEGP